MDEHLAVCQECDWEKPMPTADTAEHAKRVHEDATGHSVVLET